MEPQICTWLKFTFSDKLKIVTWLQTSNKNAQIPGKEIKRKRKKYEVGEVKNHFIGRLLTFQYKSAPSAELEIIFFVNNLISDSAYKL